MTTRREAAAVDVKYFFTDSTRWYRYYGYRDRFVINRVSLLRGEKQISRHVESGAGENHSGLQHVCIEQDSSS